MSNYHASLVQLTKMLENLDRWITAAEEFAKKKSFDPNVFMTARLAPDQYAFGRQVQATCDNAKFFAARLTGKTPPAHPDTEQTLAELHKRVQSVLENLRTYTTADFEGSESREVTLQFAPGKAIKGSDYLIEMALPNFYFHISMAYAILRHNGVDLGKRDFIGSLNMYDVAAQKS